MLDWPSKMKTWTGLVMSAGFPSGLVMFVVSSWADTGIAAMASNPTALSANRRKTYSWHLQSLDPQRVVEF